jgi:adenine-specific DNA-methyltransferase
MLSFPLSTLSMAELIWDGKYDEHGNKRAPVRIELPFQTVETVNESVQERQRTLELSSSGHDPEWRNRLIWGDKKYVLPSLLPEFAGKVDLIYIDPPFDTGADFSFTAMIPDLTDDEAEEVTFAKEPSFLEQKAYRDTWGVSRDDSERGVTTFDRYTRWFYDAAVVLRDLLADHGSIYVHIGPNMSHYVKTVLDEVFGGENYANEIVWRRAFAHSDSGRCGIIHDNILLYGKTQSRKWNRVLQAPSKDYVEQFFDQYDEQRKERYARITLTGPGATKDGESGKPWRGINPSAIGRHWAASHAELDRLDKEGRIHWPKKGVPRLKRFESEYEGMVLQDIWTDINKIHNQSSELLNYPTQKPEALVERILRASCDEGNLVLDCFCGSGTTAAVAEKFNRRWIACDLGRFAIHTTRKRLLGIPGVKPFIVQNLGKYERQQWQVAEFPSNGKDRLAEQKEREAAYRGFILDLYHATPVSGHIWLHGVKGGRMVHVAAVDAPVTRADVNSIAAEVWKASGKGPNSPQRPAVDVLGWEFALDMNETAKQVAAEARVDAAFKKIPREVLEKKAVEQGDVYFFELGALSVDSKIKKHELTLTLSDFVIPSDDVPAEVRSAIKHWSQMVDYWAVDWDFKDDTFHNQWQSYRTRKDPKLELAVKHEYVDPGKYEVVVKVIDILGNDTTKMLTIQIK